MKEEIKQKLEKLINDVCVNNTYIIDEPEVKEIAEKAFNLGIKSIEEVFPKDLDEELNSKEL